MASRIPLNPNPEERSRIVDAALKHAFGTSVKPQVTKEMALAERVSKINEFVRTNLLAVISASNGHRDPEKLMPLACKLYEQHLSALDRDEQLFMLCSVMGEKIMDYL